MKRAKGTSYWRGPPSSSRSAVNAAPNTALAMRMYSSTSQPSLRRKAASSARLVTRLPSGSSSAMASSGYLPGGAMSMARRSLNMSRLQSSVSTLLRRASACVGCSWCRRVDQPFFRPGKSVPLISRGSRTGPSLPGTFSSAKYDSSSSSRTRDGSGDWRLVAARCPAAPLLRSSAKFFPSAVAPRSSGETMPSMRRTSRARASTERRRFGRNQVSGKGTLAPSTCCACASSVSTTIWPVLGQSDLRLSRKSDMAIAPSKRPGTRS
mmetsp:Transcript_178/g.605  ORF Transcript_178/g.605 Transcript_178/m.605 type:complete len:266 (+) Transcript_178:724-1521(+)